MKVCLDLFSGLGGFSAAFDGSTEWEVVTVDLDPEDRFEPDLKADMLELTPADLLAAIGYDREEIDVLVVLAGHPCTLFSTAGNHDEWDLDAKEPAGDRARRHTAMLFHTLGLIRALAPDYWYLENPRRSRARWLIGPPDEWVSYCQYGEDYQKDTGLWGDHAPGMTYRKCAGNPGCHAPNTETDGTCAIASMDRTDHGNRSKVPYELSKAILGAVEGQGEQSTLPLVSADGGFTEVADVGGEAE